MILCQIEQHRGLRRKTDGVLQLEGGGLAYDRRGAVERAEQRAGGRADVPRHRDGQAGLPMDVADQLDRRGLAVRPGYRDELVLDHPPCELELADHDEAALARGRDQRRLRRHSGTLHDRAHAGQQLGPLLAEAQLHARMRKRLCARAGIRV